MGAISARVMNRISKDEKDVLWILEDDMSSQFVYDEILGFQYKIKFLKTISEFKKKLNHSREKPDLVIADLRLPDGLFLNFLASATTQTVLGSPYIVVSSVNDVEVMRLCFGDGTFNYLTKPFGKGELVGKVEHALKLEITELLSCGESSIKIDPISCRVSRGDTWIHLTNVEIQILALLYKSSERKLSRSALVKRVLGVGPLSEKIFNIHLLNLRRKVAALGIDVACPHLDCYELKLT